MTMGSVQFGQLNLVERYQHTWPKNLGQPVANNLKSAFEQRVGAFSELPFDVEVRQATGFQANPPFPCQHLFFSFQKPDTFEWKNEALWQQEADYDTALFKVSNHVPVSSGQPGTAVLNILNQAETFRDRLLDLRRQEKVDW